MQNRIRKDMLRAMKDNHTIKKETLRLLLSKIKNEEIKLRRDLKDDDITKLIKHSLKMRQESLKLFLQGNRQDLADKTQAEIKVIKTYLPEQLSLPEVEKIVTTAISELGASTQKDTGKVIKAIMEKYAAQVDGKTIQQIVSSKLAQNK